MAFEIGTASNRNDLLVKIRDFAKANGWTQVAGATDGAVQAGALSGTPVVLKSPSATLADEFYVYLGTETDVGSDIYNIALGVSSLFDMAVDPNLNAQGTASPATTINCWNQPTPYWLSVTSRRIVLLARVDTTYQWGYAGLTLPYHLPTSWFKPLYVGGSCRTSVVRYSSVTNNHRAFWDGSRGVASLLFPDNIWRNVNNYDNSTSTAGGTESVTNTEPGRFHKLSAIRENVDGTRTLFPIRIITTTPYNAQMCALDGVFRVSGFGMASETVIEIGGTDYIVGQDTFRLTVDSYAAMILE